MYSEFACSMKLECCCAIIGDCSMLEKNNRHWLINNSKSSFVIYWEKKSWKWFIVFKSCTRLNVKQLIHSTKLLCCMDSGIGVDICLKC